MTLEKDPESKRSLKRALRNFQGSRPVRRAKKRLAIATQGQLNITEWRRIHYVSEAKAHIPGAMAYN